MQDEHHKDVSPEVRCEVFLMLRTHFLHCLKYLDTYINCHQLGGIRCIDYDDCVHDDEHT